jgi:hypothetical protein
MHSKNAVYSIYDAIILSKYFLFKVNDKFNFTEYNKEINLCFALQAAGIIITFLATIIQFHLLALALHNKHLHS